MRFPSRAAWLLLTLPACADGGTDVNPAPAPQGGGAGAAGSIQAGSTGAGMGGTQGGSAGSAAAPVIVGVAFSVGTTSDLCGRVEVDVASDAAVTLRFSEPGGHELVVDSATPAKAHKLRWLGLKPGRKYSMIVTAKVSGAEASSTPILHTTKPLPDDFPPVTKVIGDAKQKGFTMFPVSRLGAMGLDGNWGYVVAVDGAGDVVWYVPTYSDITDVRRIEGGRLRMIARARALVDIDMIDGSVTAVEAVSLLPGKKGTPGVTPVDLDTIHHDALELPEGKALVLATEARLVTKATCPKYDADHQVVGDSMAEIDLATGAVISKVSTFDLIDPCRLYPGAAQNPFWWAIYGKGAIDWTHGNSVFLDQKNNLVLTSLRAQDWVLAYDRGTGKLVWTFGPDGDFKLKGDGAMWAYKQHAAEMLSNGHILMYDNGLGRPGTDDTKLDKLPASRAVEFAIDTSGPKGTWTATQVWSYGESDVRLTEGGVAVPWYSSAVGDVDITPADTALIVHGVATDPPNGSLANPDTKKLARIFEVSRKDGKVLLDIRVEDPKKTGFGNYLVYRAERYASLDLTKP